MPAAAIPIAASVAGSVAGGLFGDNKGSGGSQQSSQSVSPWGPQQPYLETGFQQAQTDFNNAKANGPYSGEYYAGLTGPQNAAIGNAVNFSSGTGNNLSGLVAGNVQGLEGAATPYLSNAERIAGNGITGPNAAEMGLFSGYSANPTSASYINPALMGGLEGGAMNATGSINALTNGQQSILDHALSDPTQRLAGDAGSYMSSAPVQGAIANANQQIQDALNERTLPGIQQGAAASGALNSSREGMEEGLARQGAALATGQADSSILNNAFNTGLGAAANTYTQGLNTGMWDTSMGLNADNGIAEGAAGTQLGQSEFNTNTALGAANSGLANALNYENSGVNARLAGNSQLGSAVNLGSNNAAAAEGLATGNFNLGAAAGGLQQQGNQIADNNSLATWQMNTNYPWQMLDNYWSIVGRPEGSSSTGSSQATLGQSPFSNALGGAAAGAGLYNEFFPNGVGGAGGNASAGTNVSALYPSYAAQTSGIPGLGLYSYQ